MNKLIILMVIALISGESLIAQNKSHDSLAAMQKDTNTNWSFHAEVDYYTYSYATDILMLIATADKQILHLETRYNYEARNTASVFSGLNFTMGNRLQLVLTPMAGLVFGKTNAFAPGLEADLRYKIFEASAQAEYLFDFAGKDNYYLYIWSQIGAKIFRNFSTGIAVQRTRLYQTNMDLQRGLYVQYSFKKFSAGAFYFDPLSADYFFVATIAIDL